MGKFTAAAMEACRHGNKLRRGFQPPHKRGCCVAMLEEPSSHRGLCHLPVLQQPIPLALPAWEMRHQLCLTGEKLFLKASKLHSFSLRVLAPEALLFLCPK